MSLETTQLKPAQYLRKGRVIHKVTLNGDGSHTISLHQQFESLNLARTASHDIQMLHDGALGRGSVRLWEKFV